MFTACRFPASQLDRSIRALEADRSLFTRQGPSISQGRVFLEYAFTNSILGVQARNFTSDTVAWRGPRLLSERLSFGRCLQQSLSAHSPQSISPPPPSIHPAASPTIEYVTPTMWFCGSQGACA